MNKRILLVFSLCCVLAVLPLAQGNVRVVSTMDDSLEVEFRLSDFHVEETEQDGVQAQRISFYECAYTTEEGLPKLPMQTTLLGIPVDGDVSLEIVHTQSRRENVREVETVPRRAMTQNVQGDLIGTTLPYRAAQPSGIYPSQIAVLGTPGLIRDQRVVPVRFHPVQYDAKTGQLRVHERIRVMIRFQRGNAAPSLGVPRRESQVYERELENLLINYEASRRWRQQKSTSLLAAPAISNVSNQESVRIGIEDEGMYRLTYDTLKETGVPLKGLDPRTLKMFHRGIQIPIFVRGEYDQRFDEHDEVIFFGARLRGEKTYINPYSLENVYWLAWGGKPGRRMAKRKLEVPVEQTRRYSKYRYMVHAEEDNSFTRLGEVNDTTEGTYVPIRGGVFQRQAQGGLVLPDLPVDSWFWDSIPHSSVREYNIHLPGVAETSLSSAIRVMMHGLTSHLATPDHHTILWINGERQLHDELWDGQSIFSFETNELSQDFLRPGQNRLIVMSPGDTGAGDVDQVLFNWFEIEYWRDFEAENNVLEFSVPASEPQPFNVVLSNFTSPDIEIYGVDGSLYVDSLVLEDDQNPGTYVLRFISVPKVRDPQDPTVEYIALTRDRFKDPKWTRMDDPSDLRSPLNGADYVVIAHESLAGGTQPLLEWREQQGHRVMLVTTQDIYDEFNGGIFDPNAIRDFLAYAYENWQQPAPSYVLLVGDASLHYRTDVNYVPTLLVQTPKYGAAASDNRFVTIRGNDSYPDMRIGRLPVRNLVDLNTIVQKILTYERSPELGTWRRDLLFLGGAGQTFVDQTERLIQDYVPNEFRISQISANNPSSEFYGGAREVIDSFNAGQLLINFIGHGGGSIWSDNRMLGLEDIPLLENGSRLPFVVSMTCFTGYFDNPHSSCLGEEMLKVSEGGAIAFFGDTGLGWLLGDFYLTRKFYRHLFLDQVFVLGDLVSMAKTSFLTDYPDYMDLAEMFTLFGDPALRFGAPPTDVALDSLPVVDHSSVLPVSGTVAQGFDGNLDLQITDSRGRLLDAVQTPVSGGRFQAQLSISQLANSGTGVIRAYAWNESEDAMGMASYTINAPHIDQVTLSDEVVSPAVAPHLAAHIISSSGISEVMAHWSLDKTHWQSIPMSPSGDNRYDTIEPIPERFAGSVVYYYISVTDSQGNTGESLTQTYQVQNYADLTFGTPAIARRASVPQSLVTNVRNRGELVARNVAVRFFMGDPSLGKQIGSDVKIPSLPPGEAREASLYWEPPTDEDQVEIHVVLDPDHNIREFNETNNQLSETFSPNRFVVTVLAGTGGEVPSLDGKLAVEVPAGVVASDSVLVIEKQEATEALAQPDIHYVDAEPTNYSITLMTGEQEIGNVQGQVTFFLDSAAGAAAPSESGLGIYHFDPVHERWVRTSDALLPEDKVVGTFTRSGLYALLRTTDQTPPEIALTVEHQGFINGSYVSSAPVISAIISDANGIDMREQKIVLLLNHKEVPRSDYNFESSGPRAFLSFAPTLTEGGHAVTLQVSDTNGNTATTDASMQVAEELRVDKVANFPNPLVPGRKERRLGTTFAYLLTKEADRVIVKIYTVTGRLVRTLEGLDTSPDYNEFHWDGFDSDGEELPNGVYLYQFVAERAGKTTKKPGTLAILR